MKKQIKKQALLNPYIVFSGNSNEYNKYFDISECMVCYAGRLKRKNTYGAIAIQVNTTTQTRPLRIL